MIDLECQDIKFLPGVGPQRAKLLGDELQIRTLHDLLYTFPYKHIDRTRLYYIHELTADMPYVQIRGQILSFDTEGEGRKRRLVAHFTDGQGVVDLIWFNGIKYVLSAYKTRTDYIVFGRPSVFNGRINIAHPDVDKADELRLNTMGLQPYYTTTDKMKRAGLNSRSIEHFTATLFERLDAEIPETLPPYLVSSLNLVSLDEALRHVHYPTSAEDLRKAQFRLKFEELFYIQLNIIKYARERRQKYRGYVFARVGELFHTFYEKNLPFELTGAQKRVIREIRQDMGSGRQMNRLLQGDVGSGKTVISALALAKAVENGYQGCIMVPTEILAAQHFETLEQYLQPYGVRIALLTGGMRAKARRELLLNLELGLVDVVVGTHALLEEDVRFANLSLTVTDEQHRFGVEQRARLSNKSANAPDVLVMTATPIPRTLALTVYGDLDISVMKGRPPQRKPVRTLCYTDERRREVYAGLVRQVQAGRQAYVVCPLIEESDVLAVHSAERVYEELKRDFLQDIPCALLHGRLKGAEKDAIMSSFAAGELKVLVSTTVIEVGVNVPNATLMVIENAERFGLAQLHQLRGRVGRGSEQSYCVLLTAADSPEALARLNVLHESEDGFYLAEKDMEQRGAGQLFGLKQHGLPDLRIADIMRDVDVIAQVRQLAQAQLRTPEDWAEIRRLVEMQFGERFNMIFNT